MPTGLFDFVKETESSSQNSSRKGSTRRLVVFVMGGITLSELRVAAEAASKYKASEIIVGGSKILTPNIFLKDLKNLNKMEVSNTDQEGSVPTEEEPLIGNGVGHSSIDITNGDESIHATCERYLRQGGRFITETFGACTSNICAKSA